MSGRAGREAQERVGLENALLALVRYHTGPLKKLIYILSFSMSCAEWLGKSIRAMQKWSDSIFPTAADL